MQQEKLQIYMIGRGAVASSLSCVLQQCANISFLGRQGPISREFSVVLKEASQTCKFNAVHTYNQALYIFCVKAHQLESAAVQHATQIPAGSQALVICNGYIDATFETICQEFRHIQWLRGVCAYGTTRRVGALEQYEVYGEPKISLDSHDKRWASMAECDVFEQDDHFVKTLQLKLYVNLVLNTLTAAYDMERNAQALEYQPELQELAEECFAFISELYGEKRTIEFDEANSILHEIIVKTADNMNSMVADLRTGRQTEVRYLSGVAQGKGDYPLLNKLHRLILAREAKVAKIKPTQKEFL